MSESISERREVTKESVDDLFKLFPDLFGTDSKIDLTLVLLGIKPATDLMCVVDRNDLSEDAEKKRDNYVEQLTYQLELLGLTVVSLDRKTSTEKRPNWADARWLFVSMDPRKAVRLSEIFLTKDKKEQIENALEIGQLLGFPETASRAYIEAVRTKRTTGPKGPLFPVGEEPKELREQEWYPFLQFRLSREHWQDEIKTVQRWAEAIKSFSPELYRSKTGK